MKLWNTQIILRGIRSFTFIVTPLLRPARATPSEVDSVASTVTIPDTPPPLERTLSRKMSSRSLSGSGNRSFREPKTPKSRTERRKDFHSQNSIPDFEIEGEVLVI